MHIDTASGKTGGVCAIPLRGMPLFDSRTDLACEVCAAVVRAGEVLRAGDIIVLAQKSVSKREGRVVDTASISPTAAAQQLAEATGRAPEVAQLILGESSEVLRATPAAIIARHRTGHVLANAGIDASNVAASDAGKLLLWPEDPDASARAIRAEIMALTGVSPAVVIADSMGRAWRIGTVGTAIGCAGLVVVDDRRNKGADLFGRVLQATQIAIADSIAALGTFVMGEGDEGTPAALVRGAQAWVTDADGPGATTGVRPIEQDLFR